jgi:thioredoxin-like negative regulator of GroEL
MNNPDLMHLYGVLLFKAGAAEEAAEVLEQAVAELEKQGGVVSARSDVLNNAINVQEHLQANELAAIAKRPSRYATATKAPAAPPA